MKLPLLTAILISMGATLALAPRPAPTYKAVSIEPRPCEGDKRDFGDFRPQTICREA